MNNQSNCLDDQDLTLIYYRELVEPAVTVHLEGCRICQKRLNVLSQDLSQLPEGSVDLDPTVATRMAARVVSKLNSHKRRSRWLPAVSSLSIAAAALFFMTLWTPANRDTRYTTFPIATIDTELVLDERDLPDSEFIENLDLLEHLDLMRQLEGV